MFVCCMLQRIISTCKHVTKSLTQVKLPPEGTAPRCKLQVIANELLQTERIYVQRLRLLQEVKICLHCVTS